MRLWSLILLSLVCLGLSAGEEATAPATTTPPVTTAAPAVEATKPAEPPAPKPTSFFLKNELVSVEILDQQGAIRQLDLLQTHPVRLHAWQAKAQENKGQTVTDPAKPLPVLAAFNPKGSWHNWMTGIGVADKAQWTKVSGDDTHLVLVHETAAGRWTLRYDLPANTLALRSTLTIENLGKTDLTLTPKLYPLNGVHQDDVKQDAAYLALVHHNGGEKEKMHSLYLPALPAAGHPGTPTPIPSDQLGYVCLKSRFFGAFWHPLGHQVIDPATAAAPAASAAPSNSADGGPGGGPGGPQPTAVAGSAMQVQAVAFKDNNGGHQAYVEATLLGQGGGPVVIKPTQKLEASWTITAASMTKRDRELLGDVAGYVEYSDGYYKFFNILVWPLTLLLDWLVLVVQNYGVAVVIMTFLIKLALHRTTFKQHESMMKMQKLAPELKLLQEQ